MSADGERDIFGEEGTEVRNETADHGNKIQPRSLIEVLEITVADLDKRAVTKGSLKLQETYVAYLVETKPRDLEHVDPRFKEVTSVWRRYSEFELLRNYLVVMYPAIVMPPLPEKRASFLWTKITTDAFDQDFLERRRFGLELFLHRVCSLPKMDEIIVTFLKQEEGWREGVMGTGYHMKADSWLKTMNASFRVKQHDPAFDEIKTFSASLQDDISVVLKERAKLADRVYGLYKIHANYSRIFKEWSAIEDKPMAAALRKAALEIEKFSNSIDALMEEEELYAEQLKVYFNFGNSTKAIVKKHEALQYDVECIENQLSSAYLEKKQISGETSAGLSFSGMKLKLFGGDTPEQKKVKLENVEEKIKSLKAQLEERKNIADSFNSEAKEEILKFKRKKQADLREMLTAYVILQVKISKEAKGTWDRFKAAIMSG